MGVLTMELKKVNKTIVDNQKMVEKLEKKSEQEKERKQYEKDLLLACQNDVKESMNRVFETCVGTSIDETVLDIALYKFYDINTRNEYISTFGKSTIERNYIDKIYDKTLKQVYNKWKNQIKYNQMQEVIKNKDKLLEQQIQEEQDEKFERNVRIFFNILKWICIIIFAPIVLLFIFISMCAKGK